MVSFLRSYYADCTFRRLARAIISIETHDFRVEEDSLGWQPSFLGGNWYVSVVDVSTWESYESHMLSIKGTTVILNQYLQAALETARDDVKEIIETISSADQKEQNLFASISTTYDALPR
jgi:hypothetical protein